MQPYPFYYEDKSLRIIALLFLIMTFLFNYFFEPFSVVPSEHKMNYFWISAIHASTPVVVLLTLSFFANSLKMEPRWNIIKEVFFIFTFLLMVGIVQFLIRDLIYDNHNNWSWHFLLEEVRNTFLVGSLFVLILVPWNFDRLNVKNIRKANDLNRSITKSTVIDNGIAGRGNLKVDNLEIDFDHLLFAKSEGNYLEIYLQDKNPNKMLVRFTLKELEVLLSTYPNIIKTHRSYLVNSNYIENITGNAQGYQLHLKNYVVPVSRNLIASFNSRIKMA